MACGPHLACGASFSSPQGYWWATTSCGGHGLPQNEGLSGPAGQNHRQQAWLISAAVPKPLSHPQTSTFARPLSPNLLLSLDSSYCPWMTSTTARLLSPDLLPLLDPALLPLDSPPPDHSLPLDPPTTITAVVAAAVADLSQAGSSL